MPLLYTATKTARSCGQSRSSFDTIINVKVHERQIFSTDSFIYINVCTIYRTHTHARAHDYLVLVYICVVDNIYNRYVTFDCEFVYKTRTYSCNRILSFKKQYTNVYCIYNSYKRWGTHTVALLLFKYYPETESSQTSRSKTSQTNHHQLLVSHFHIFFYRVVVCLFFLLVYLFVYINILILVLLSVAFVRSEYVLCICVHVLYAYVCI